MLISDQKLCILPKVDSTNNYAMAMIKKGVRSGIQPVLALEQTGGKGRRGKRWNSEVAENIMVSIPVEMNWLPLTRQFELSVAVSLACYDLFSSFILANLFIKWPNDIFINDSKAGGILVENLVKGTLWQWAVVGIGLNINQKSFDNYDFKATSLFKETNRSFDIISLTKELLSLLDKRIIAVSKGQFSKMLEEYNDHLFAKNKQVNLQKEEQVFITKIKSVSQSGQLITEDTTEHLFSFDEITFLGIV